jgi:hypothetical protein
VPSTDYTRKAKARVPMPLSIDNADVFKTLLPKPVLPRQPSAAKMSF